MERSKIIISKIKKNENMKKMEKNKKQKEGSTADYKYLL